MRVEIIEQFGQENEFVFLDNENSSYTSMLKLTYDEMIAAQSTPSIPEGGN